MVGWQQKHSSPLPKQPRGMLRSLKTRLRDGGAYMGRQAVVRFARVAAPHGLQHAAAPALRWHVQHPADVAPAVDDLQGSHICKIFAGGLAPAICIIHSCRDALATRLC